MSAIHECDDCGSIVEIDEIDNNAVVLSCDCPESKLAFFEDAPPEGWP